MHALLHTEFVALLTGAGVSQAGLARSTGLNARQVNIWCGGRAVVPPWAAALAVMLQQHSPEAIAMLIENTDFAWHEPLGVPPNTDPDTVRVVMRRLALRYHPDQGGAAAKMTRINAAYARANTTAANRRPPERRPSESNANAARHAQPRR